LGWLSFSFKAANFHDMPAGTHRETIGSMRTNRSIKLFSAWAGKSSLVAAVALSVIGVAPGADTPITPNASPEAQSLLAYFSDIYGKKSYLASRKAGAGKTAWPSSSVTSKKPRASCRR
jgi:hypothetical protein